MNDTIRQQYIDRLRSFFRERTPAVLKSPVATLRHPFIDPGSVYDGNLWDWDSYWSAYALLNATDDPAMRERVLEHARGNVRNFMDLQLEDGYIPMMVESKKFADPYLLAKHREGVVLNMHKPFLCQQAVLVSEAQGGWEWLREYAGNLERYFGCYDRHYYFENCGMYVWADDIMIGMDNDPATFGRPPFSTANLFLNGFMVQELLAMALIQEKLGLPDRAAHYRAKASALADAVQAECWDPRDRFFYSADVDVKTRRFDWFHVGLGVFWKTLPIKIRAFSGFLPLWAGFATPEQAGSLVRHAMDEDTFKSPFGIRSLSRDEKMYDLSATNNPSNWLGPIWVIASYVVFRGLMRYGYAAEAREICDKTVALLGGDLERTGTLHEYYVPETGEPVMNGGFINWNMLVLNMVDELDGKPAMGGLPMPG
ncbi:MAG: trehalase / alfa-L-rhamnosidase / mannosyl oligosaccharide glucosidase [Clostridia bacterium]|nr:trehalase / alfa-L-rhamnosidase / mannosyl oligosaccharide glucosidase [Clostridia bacterium]